MAGTYMLIKLIFPILLVVHQVYGAKLYAYFESVNCSFYDPDYIELVKCSLGTDERRRITASGELLLKRDITNCQLKYRFIIERMNKNTTYLDLDIDVCKALSEFYENPVLRLTVEGLRRASTNVPYECPIKKDIKYELKDFTIDLKYIPPFVPEMRWIAESEYYINGSDTLRAYVVMTGRVGRKGVRGR